MTWFRTNKSTSRSFNVRFIVLLCTCFVGSSVGVVAAQSTSSSSSSNEGACAAVVDDDDSASRRRGRVGVGAARSRVGRLLCAARVAYGLDDDDGPRYFRGAGYRTGTTARRLTRSVDSVFVGRSVDGVVVAFRGTSTSNPYDWLRTNAAVALRTTTALPGRVHAGYLRAVRSLWEPLAEELRRLVSNDDDDDDDDDDELRLYLTGHSKGGAMASIAAALLAVDPTLPNATEVVTFASARPGDSGFRDAYHDPGRLGVTQYSYEAHLDVVPCSRSPFTVDAERSPWSFDSDNVRARPKAARGRPRPRSKRAGGGGTDGGTTERWERGASSIGTPTSSTASTANSTGTGSGTSSGKRFCARDASPRRTASDARRRRRRPARATATGTCFGRWPTRFATTTTDTKSRRRRRSLGDEHRRRRRIGRFRARSRR